MTILPLSTNGPGDALGAATSATASRDRLKAACADMESLFLYQLMEEMRAATPKSGLLDGGAGEDTFRSLLHMALARDLSAAQGLGLGDLLYEQLRGTGKNPGPSSPAPKADPDRPIIQIRNHGNRIREKGWKSHGNIQ